MNKPAGIITRIGADGKPVLSPKNDLSGVKIADVVGWAPTDDGLYFGTNTCTGNRFTGFEMISPPSTYSWTGTDSDGASVSADLTNANDIAMAYLHDGLVDGVWIYADQAHNYDCSHLNGVTPTWECALWKNFGTDYTYVHTGIFEHAHNGTTLTLARKGSGVAELVNPCIQKFLKTPEYKEICEKHGLVDICYPNEHFEAREDVALTWETATNALTTACSDGYCQCNAAD